MQHKRTRKFFFEKKFFFLALIIFFLASCQESKEKKYVSIHRFEQALFSANKSKDVDKYLLSIEKQYEPMFATSLEDTNYLNVVKEFIKDKEMNNAYNLVKIQYPDLKNLEEELSNALHEIKQIKQDTINSEIYTLIVGPAEYSQAFQNRILVYPEFSAISIDLYSIEKLSNHPYYKTIPQYLHTSLGKENIAPHYVNTYLKEITFRNIPLQSQNPEATLLDCILEEGKYIYATEAVLEEKPLNYILEYTKEQLEWVEQNEANIWAYMIENQLLYNKDRTKYFHLIAPGPSTKNIANSPARIGNYIGYKIVESYMKENSISIDSLFNTLDSKLILQQSKYKPRK
jgi:Skp family chaperone for outer membrane proteins